jgi:crotonobetainyl-CoA:carnitine CoA-transferase CaiB-like acyl-CoA transferase
VSALSGIRVLDLTRLLPGPYCTLVLADLGATVDKVEEIGTGDYLRHMPPFEGGVSGMFLSLNRDKRSLALDLKAEGGAALLLELVRAHDVVVEGFRPGVLARLGAGPAEMLRANSAAIVCSITGFGQTGPLAQRAGHDIGYLARAGVLGLQGPAGGVPQVLGVQLADIAGGGLWSVVAILAALVEQKSTGLGKHLDVAMVDGAHAFLTAALGSFFADGRAPARGAEPLTGGIAAYRTYATKDGQHVAVGALEPKFWTNLCDAIGVEVDFGALLPGPHQVALQARLEAVFAGKTRAEWAEILGRTDTCAEPILTLPETLEDPHLCARGVAKNHDVRTPVGPRGPHRPAPRLGEHTDEILREAGVSADRINALRATRTVA